jgi:hypothetical protein
MRKDGTSPKFNNPPPPEIEIAPGSTMEFKSFDTAGVIQSLGASHADEIQAQANSQADAIQAQAYSLADHFSKVNLSIGTIYFSNGSKWVAGRYFQAVPPPLVWEEITPTQFFSGSPIPPQ